MTESRRPSVLFIVLLVALLVGAGWWYLRHRSAPEPPLHESATPPPVIVPPPEPLVRHPLPEEVPSLAGADEGEEEASGLDAHLPAPLPDLDESDEALGELAAWLVARPSLLELLAPEDLIRRAVVTIDSLTTDSLPLPHLPLALPQGRFLVREQGEETWLDPDNFERYERHLALLEAVDPRELAAAYVRLYPLFQAAWDDLGKGGHFNDRLFEVIDHLTAAPPAPESLLLAQPSVMYVYADAETEAESSGRKLLIRMGPERAERVREWLQALRAQLAR